MATVNFFGNNFQTAISNGSGIAFCGGSAGASVQIGNWAETSWRSNSNGTVYHDQLHNIRYLNAGSGVIDSASSGIGLNSIPNYLSTLQIEFRHTSAVKTQNNKIRIYDSYSINNNPSGVTCKVYENRHCDQTQNPTGSGLDYWEQPQGSSYIMSLVSSPGQSGTRIAGANTTQDVHHHFLSLSSSPDNLGSKMFSLYFSCEYL